MILHLDPFAGIAGDMFLGAMIDAGWPVEQLAAVPHAMGLGDRVRIDVERVMRGPLAATLVRVTPQEDEPPHRHLPEIRALIGGARIAPHVASSATAVFEALARSEAAVHGTSMDDVHFHEVGALDALVDIVGSCQALADLEITHVTSGPLPLGDGWVQTQHGPLPIPAPATAALLAAAQAPTTAPPAGAAGELVTPTGAALVSSLAQFARPAMSLEHIGYGAGSRDPQGYPNVLRVMIGHALVEQAGDVVVLETHLDDIAGELLSDACAALRAAGALDVSVTPIQMKKGRNGFRLTVVAEPAAEATMVREMLEHTPSLGVRMRSERRHVLPRAEAFVDTPVGRLPVKLRRTPSGRVDAAPEHADCRETAERLGITVGEVFSQVSAAARRALDDGSLVWPPEPPAPVRLFP